MSNLRAKIIRLAHENPELRNDLLPLLKEGGSIEKTARRFGVQEVNMHMNGGFATFTYALPQKTDLSWVIRQSKGLDSIVNGGKVEKAVQSVCQKYTKGDAKCVVSVYGHHIQIGGGFLICDAEIKYDAFPTDADFQPVKSQFTKDMQQALSSIR